MGNCCGSEHDGESEPLVNNQNRRYNTGNVNHNRVPPVVSQVDRGTNTPRLPTNYGGFSIQPQSDNQPRRFEENNDSNSRHRIQPPANNYGGALGPFQSDNQPRRVEAKSKIQQTYLQISNKVLATTSSGTKIIQGTFGTRKVAMKKISLQNIAKAEREINILEQIDDSENIIRYFLNQRDDSFIYIVLELCICDLENYKSSSIQGRISNKEIIEQLTNGIQHLHRLNIVHCDLNPKNILLSNFNDQIKVKICDFENSVIIPKNQDYTRLHQIPKNHPSLGWIAPENIYSREVGKYSDIYSLGYCFFYLVSNGQKLDQVSPNDTAYSKLLIIHFWLDKFKDVSGEFKNPKEASDNVLAQTLIMNMIRISSEERWPIQKIRAHPYFWDASKVLSFIRDFSKCLEVSQQNNDNELFKALQKDSLEIVGNDWTQKITEEPIRKELEKKYGDLAAVSVGNNRKLRIQHLIRSIRNMLAHMDDSSVEVQQVVGITDEDFKNYWLGKFPLLLDHMWRTAAKVRRPILDKYFT